MFSRTRHATLVFGASFLVACGVGKPRQTEMALAKERCTYVDQNYEQPGPTEVATLGVKTFETERCPPPPPTATDNQKCGGWWAWNDRTVGVPQADVETGTINAQEDGGPPLGVCGDGTPGHQTALVLKSYGFNDYGAGFGTGNAAPHGDLSEWDGYAFWVRVPQGTDPAMAFTVNDANTNGESLGAATRQCCGGSAAPAGAGGAGGAGALVNACATERVPLVRCYATTTDKNNGAYSRSWTFACQNYKKPAGSTCDAWKITPALTKVEGTKDGSGALRAYIDSEVPITDYKGGGVFVDYTLDGRWNFAVACAAAPAGGGGAGGTPSASAPCNWDVTATPLGAAPSGFAGDSLDAQDQLTAEAGGVHLKSVTGTEVDRFHLVTTPGRWVTISVSLNGADAATSLAWKAGSIHHGTASTATQLLPPFGIAECDKSSSPSYMLDRCAIFKAFAEPFICDTATPTPPPASACDSWHFLLQATTDGTWSFQTVPFNTLTQTGAGKVFPGFDSHNVSDMSSGVQGGGASIEFWLDDINLFRAKK